MMPDEGDTKEHAIKSKNASGVQGLRDWGNAYKRASYPANSINKEHVMSCTPRRVDL